MVSYLYNWMANSHMCLLNIGHIWCQRIQDCMNRHQSHLNKSSQNFHIRCIHTLIYIKKKITSKVSMISLTLTCCSRSQKVSRYTIETFMTYVPIV